MKIAAISIADYAEATEGMPHDAERLFFRMLLKMYSREGGIPDDDAENARMFGYDTRVYKRLKSTLMKFPCGLVIADDEIRNSRIDDELPEIAARKKKLRDAGSKGGKSDGSSPEVREKSEGSSGEVGQKSGKSTDASHIPPQAKSTTYAKPSPSPSPSPSPTPKERNDRSTLSIGDLVEEIWLATSGRMIDDHDDPTALVKAWRRDGATDEDITETIRAVAANKREESIDHFGYFNQAVRDGIADRKAGRKNRHVPEKEMTQAEWFAMKRAESAARDLAEAETHGSA